VEPLRKLLESRNRLRDLMSKVDRSAELEGILEQVLKNQGDLQKLVSELGVEGGQEGTTPEAAGDDKPQS
jgi:type VI secretion system protein ImpB